MFVKIVVVCTAVNHIHWRYDYTTSCDCSKRLDVLFMSSSLPLSILILNSFIVTKFESSWQNVSTLNQGPFLHQGPFFTPRAIFYTKEDAENFLSLKALLICELVFVQSCL